MTPSKKSPKTKRPRQKVDFRCFAENGTLSGSAAGDGLRRKEERVCQSVRSRSQKLRLIHFETWFDFKRDLPFEQTERPLFSMLPSRWLNDCDSPLRSAVRHRDRFSMLHRFQNLGESGFELCNRHRLHPFQQRRSEGRNCQLVSFVWPRAWVRSPPRPRRPPREIPTPIRRYVSPPFRASFRFMSLF
jgi:hypothetical protein